MEVYLLDYRLLLAVSVLRLKNIWVFMIFYECDWLLHFVYTIRKKEF